MSENQNNIPKDHNGAQKQPNQKNGNGKHHRRRSHGGRPHHERDGAQTANQPKTDNTASQGNHGENLNAGRQQNNHPQQNNQNQQGANKKDTKTDGASRRDVFTIPTKRPTKPKSSCPSCVRESLCRRQTVPNR